MRSEQVPPPSHRRAVIVRFQKNALHMRHLFMPLNHIGYIARSAAMRAIAHPAVNRIAKAAPG